MQCVKIIARTVGLPCNNANCTGLLFCVSKVSFKIKMLLVEIVFAVESVAGLQHDFVLSSTGAFCLGEQLNKTVRMKTERRIFFTVFFI